MKPSDYPRRRREHRDPLRDRRMLARLDPGRARASAASARSCWATTPKRCCATLQDRFPQARLIGGDADFESAGRQGRRLRRGARARPRPAARRARHGLPAAGLAGAARDPGGQDRELRRDRRDGSARRKRCARWRRPAPPTRSRWRSPATASCARTARSPAIAGASSASGRCSQREKAGVNVAGEDRRGAIAAARHRARIDWSARRRRARRHGRCGAGAAADAAGVPRDRGPLRRRQPLPQPHRHGAARFRAGRVQILRLSAARRWSRRCAPRSIRTSRRSPMRGTSAWASSRAIPRSTREFLDAVPRGRPDAPDAAAAAIRGGRLQLPAPGPLRRARLPAAGRDPALGAGRGFHRRRVRADRAAAAHADARRGRAARAGRRGGLRGASPAGARARAAPTASTCATA